MKSFIVVLLSFVSLSAFSSSIEFMTYNLENLFDAQHDQGKDDFSYLPKKMKGKREACEKIKYHRYRNECLRNDWTEKRVILKLRQIQWAMSVNRDQKLPDFLAIQEVENPNVVGMLAKRLGYKTFKMTNSPDKRGIDVALLFNEGKHVKFVKMKEHVIHGDYFKKKPTRNILEVELKIDNKPVTVFVNHWPSLGNPTKTRIAAAKTLKKRIESILATDKKHGIVAMGDFNTIDENYPHPFKSVLLDGGKVKDVYELYMGSRKIDRDKKKELPQGTYFYPPKMQWNMLDHIFISSNLENKVELETYTIHNTKILTSVYEYTKGPYKGSRIVGIPKEYNHTASKKNKAGFSDHFGVSVKINF